jgi:tetratricopeptide (TPR) repeat protein
MPRAVAGRGDDPLRRAMAALDGGHPQEAERMVAEVLKHDPHHARALYIRGGALIMQGRAAEAVVPLEAAVRGRHDPEIDTMLAIALRQSGRDDDALRRLKLATKRRPPYAVAFKELGNLLVMLRRYDEAIETLKRGIEIAPMMPLLFVEIGQAYLAQRNCRAAQTAFAQALEISPASSDALLGLAEAHQELGESEPAAACFRRYLIANPADNAAWLQLGHCLLELGQHDAGYECFRTAARGDAKRYGTALTSLAAAGRGRFWLKPSDAVRFMRRGKSEQHVKS